MKPGVTISPVRSCVALRFCEGAGRMHARDHRTDDADIGLADFERRDIGDARAAQQKIERLPALRGVDRALADLERDRLEQGYSALMPVAFTSAENFSFSAARNAANSFGELPDRRCVGGEQLLGNRGLLHDRGQRLMQFLDDRGIGLGRREQPVPDRDRHALQLGMFGKARNVLGHRRALRLGDAEGLDVAGLHVLHRHHQRQHRKIDLVAHQVGRNLRASLVGHMHHVDLADRR